MSNALHEFFNHRSDVSPLEASQQEALEVEWEEWIDLLYRQGKEWRLFDRNFNQQEGEG